MRFLLLALLLSTAVGCPNGSAPPPPDGDDTCQRPPRRDVPGLGGGIPSNLVPPVEAGVDTATIEAAEVSHYAVKNGFAREAKFSRLDQASIDASGLAVNKLTIEDWEFNGYSDLQIRQSGVVKPDLAKKALWGIVAHYNAEQRRAEELWKKAGSKEPKPLYTDLGNFLRDPNLGNWYVAPPAGVLDVPENERRAAIAILRQTDPNPTKPVSNKAQHPAKPRDYFEEWYFQLGLSKEAKPTSKGGDDAIANALWQRLALIAQLVQPVVLKPAASRNDNESSFVDGVSETIGNRYRDCVDAAVVALDELELLARIFNVAEGNNKERDLVSIAVGAFKLELADREFVVQDKEALEGAFVVRNKLWQATQMPISTQSVANASYGVERLKFTLYRMMDEMVRRATASELALFIANRWSVGMYRPWDSYIRQQFANEPAVKDYLTFTIEGKLPSGKTQSDVFQAYDGFRLDRAQLALVVHGYVRQTGNYKLPAELLP